ncbi:MAG: hypothetical protein H6732_12515 [Alphaproteobacteria bacterium]|nr:hypothetical protein [Alphaproteobacteria bacterium]
MRCDRRERRGAIQTEYVLLAVFVAAVVGVGFVLPELLGDRLVDASTHMDRGHEPAEAALPPIRSGVATSLPPAAEPWGRDPGRALGTQGDGTATESSSQD